MTSVPSPTDVARLPAAEIAGRVRAGDLLVADVAESIIARVAARDAEVEAWATFDPAYVRAQAAMLDAKAEKGLLHGVPFGIKDVINTRDLPTEHHNDRYRGSRPGVDAACVDTLREAGALIIGKTVTTEFAATNDGGPTKNPHDPTRTPGGSSSGSAASVADFQAAVGLGTQTGGSTIRPASFCGVFGWKPSWNSISREGLKMYSATCDTLGLYARATDDLQLLADVFDLDQPDTPLPTSVEGATVALCPSPVWEKASEATRSALTTAADTLRSAGANVVELVLGSPFDVIHDAHRKILSREGHAAFLNEYRNNPDLLDSFRAIVENRLGYTTDEFRQAYQVADTARTRWDDIASAYDVVLTPSAVGEAPVGIGPGSTGDASFNSMWTLLHVPVVNVPGLVGPAGMPVGVSLTARRFEDRKVIAYAGVLGDLLAAWTS